MDTQDEFEGRPWNAEPTLEWNQSDFWTRYYRELKADPERHHRITHRETAGLTINLPRLGWLPLTAGLSPRVLDAGCGIALLPHILAHWGFDVTAIDLCSETIQNDLDTTEAALARCMYVTERFPDMPGCVTIVDDPVRLLAQLRSLHRPGGLVRRFQADWHDSQFTPGSFDLIHCRNSLRLSPKAYWRQSLARFHELLAPSGVLYVESVNAIGLQDEVETLARDAGFWLSEWNGSARDPSGEKTFLGFWPTG